MKSIRFNTFETNSSSCHAVTVCRRSLYEKIMSKELFVIDDAFYYDTYHYYGNINIINERSVITYDKLIEKIKTECSKAVENGKKRTKRISKCD